MNDEEINAIIDRNNMCATEADKRGIREAYEFGRREVERFKTRVAELEAALRRVDRLHDETIRAEKAEARIAELEAALPNAERDLIAKIIDMVGKFESRGGRSAAYRIACNDIIIALRALRDETIRAEKAETSVAKLEGVPSPDKIMLTLRALKAEREEAAQDGRPNRATYLDGQIDMLKELEECISLFCLRHAKILSAFWTHWGRRSIQ